MTGGWAVVGVADVGLFGHSVRCLVRLYFCLFTPPGPTEPEIIIP